MRAVRPLAGLALLVLAAAPVARGQDRPAIVIDPGQARSYRVAVQRFADGSPSASAGKVGAFREQIAKGLEFSSVFRVIDPKAFLGPETTVSLDDGPPVVCPDWSSIGSDALVEGTLQTDATQFRVEFRVWDTTRCTKLLRKSYQQPATADPSPLARRIADDVVDAFVGVRGVSATEIAFVSNRGGSSEIYVMNADGSKARAATANRSINTFPNWSASGESILYTSYRFANKPLLFVSTRGRGKPGRVLSKLGDRMPQYRGVFAPLGPKLAVVMSNGDVAEIYTVGSDGRDLKRLTEQPRDRRLAELVAGRLPDRLRLRPHRLAADLPDERRRQRPAPDHLSGQLQHESRLVSRRPLDRLRDAPRGTVRHLADRSGRRRERPAGQPSAQRRGAELGAQRAQARVQLHAARPRRHLRDRPGRR